MHRFIYVWHLWDMAHDIEMASVAILLISLCWHRTLGEDMSGVMTNILMGVNTLRPRQNGPHFSDDIFKCSFFNENVWISIKISLKFVHKGPINNIPGDRPLSEPIMVSLVTHICVNRPQWVNTLGPERNGFPEDIFKGIFWMKMFIILIKFHRILFLSVQMTMI